MSKETEFSTVVILEPTRCLVSRSLDEDTALTIVALVSEDPTTWEEAQSVWGRYRTPQVCEHASQLALDQIARSEVLDVLNASDSWVVIDFENSRVFSGGQFTEVGRDELFYMETDELGRGIHPMPVHLPPWWELHEGVSAFRVTEPREEKISKPVVDRYVLYGDVFHMAIAQMAIKETAGAKWKIADGEQRDYYGLTVQLHRDWLMTPCEYLEGKMPRELLHGAIQWSDAVTQGQQTRYMAGAKLIAVPCDWRGYSDAPMGSQEMCMYFEYCREMIRLAWVWCMDHDVLIATETQEDAVAELVDHLGQAMKRWMSESFEDGPSPGFVIQCDRRRVPIGQGVVIEGIKDKATEQHLHDCVCPICAMIQDGVFGASFSRIDGHHLELDEEFAFSMVEAYEDWELEYGCSEEFDESEDEDEDDLDEDFDDDRKQERSVRLPQLESSSISAWTGIKSDRPLPGDRNGHMKMAFMVAEIASVLAIHSGAKDQIKELNELFGNYRKATGGKNKKEAKELKKFLESLAKRYPELVSKSADLQSYLDESQRALLNGSQNSDFFR